MAICSYGGLGTALSANLDSIIFAINQINQFGINNNDLNNLFTNLQSINAEWNFATSPKFGTNSGFLKATAGVLSFESIENSTIGLISTTIDIDTILDTDVTLFTVPTGKKLIISQAYLIPTDLTGFTSTFSASIGTNSTTYDNIFEIKVFTGLDSLNKIGQYVSLSDLLIVNNASDVIKIKVTTNSVATTFKVKCLLFGFYI
jgi:hypothetical protein